MNTANIDYGSVRYTQEFFYPYFSNGSMSVSETYVLLANGILDPGSFAPMTIFEHNEYLYCIDTRRLTIAKELQRKGKSDILKRLPIQYVKKDDASFEEQYRNLVYDRLPAMKRKGLDGSTVKLGSEINHKCCYDSKLNCFRHDLEEHISRDHLQMDISDFRKLNVAQCTQCNQEYRIIITKPGNHGFYKFIRNPTYKHIEEKVLFTTSNPWTEISLKEIHDKFLQLKRDMNIETNTVPLSRSWQNSLDLQTSVRAWPSDTNHRVPEVNTDTFTQKYCIFLVLPLFIVIAAWLLFIFNRT